MKSDIQPIADFKNIVKFEGLDALRFIAAVFVVMHHSETIKRKNGIDNFEWLGLFRNGGNAVTFFFVLSGFLITYLLLKESKKTTTIDISNFYLRRILRIWPLYFLLVFIGTVGLPLTFSMFKIDYVMPYDLKATWIYFVLFLPGMVTYLFGHHFLEFLWSIGVEEVFYLIWAPLFKLFKNRVFFLLTMVVLLKTMLSVLGLFLPENSIFNYLLNMFQFEAMAIGGMGSYFIFTRGQSLSKLFIFKPLSRVVFFAITLLYLTFHVNVDNEVWNAVFKTPVLSSLLLDFLFLYVIISVSLFRSNISKFKYKAISSLGEISYGIYMYHMIIVFGSMHFLKKYLTQFNTPWNHIVYYTIVLASTILIAALSKHFFENYFLSLRNKFDNKRHK